MKKKLLLIIVMFAICNSVISQSNKIDKILADSLINQWNIRFNSDNPDKIGEILTDDVVLISGDERNITKDSVMENFVKLRMPVISELKALNEYYKVSKQMIYTAGSYTLRVTKNNNESYIALGNYSFVWTKQKDTNYRIAYMHIESVSRQ